MEPLVCAPKRAPELRPSPLMVELLMMTLPVLTFRPPVPPLVKLRVELVTFTVPPATPTEMPEVEPAFALMVELTILEGPWMVIPVCPQ